MLFRAKLLLEKVANSVISLLFSVLLGADVNDGDIINLKNINVFLKAFKAFNLINLREIHLVFDHVISTFENVFLACVIINFLHDRFPASIRFYFGLNALGLVLFQDLLSCNDVLDFCVYFVFNVSAENAVYGLDFVVDD